MIKSITIFTKKINNNESDKKIMNPQENTKLNRQEICQGRTILQSKPIQFNIDLTGQCNITPPCVFCYSQFLGYQYGAVDVQRINKNLSWFASCERIADCSCGEPLTHPSFFSMVKQAQENKQGFVFSTNGLLLNRKKADLLVDCGENIGMSVSLNTASSETFYKINGKRFDLVVENIRYYTSRYFERYGHIPPTSISMTVMRMNKTEVIDFLRLGCELQVPIVNLRHLFDRPDATPRNDFGYYFDYQKEKLSPKEYSKIARVAREIAKELGLSVNIHWEPGDSSIAAFAEPGVKTSCNMPWKFLFYQNHSGNIFTCCYADAPLTKVRNDESLDVAWNGPELVKIRSDLLSGKLPAYCLEHGKFCPVVAKINKSSFDNTKKPIENIIIFLHRRSEMIKKLLNGLFCLILVFVTGCASVIINVDNPELKVTKEKSGFHIMGQTTKAANASVGFPSKINLDKSFTVSAKILLVKGLNVSSNFCLVVVTNDHKSFSFGPRGNSKTYLAAYDNKPIIDQSNQKPLFGDEDKNFHQLTVEYDGASKIFTANVDNVIFGQIEADQVLSGSASFNQIVLNCNAPTKTEFDVTYKDIKIKK